MTNPSIESIVEALLFCSGRSLKPSEISEQSGHPESVIIESLSTLQNQYRRRRDSALTVVEVGGRWSMEVHPRLSAYLPSELRGDIPDRLQRAAALIAFHHQ